MKFISIIIILFIALFFSTCAEEKLLSGIDEIDFSFEKLTQEPVDKLVKEYSVVTLETNDSSFFPIVLKILNYGDRIYVPTRIGRNSSVLIFSFDGKYLGKLEKRGKGVGEYIAMNDVDIHPETGFISILDGTTRKILNYNQKCEYQDEVRLDCWAKELGYFVQGGKAYTALTTKSSKHDKSEENELMVLNETGTVINSALPVKSTLSVRLGNNIQMMNLGGSVNYRGSNSNLVYSISKDSVYIRYAMRFPYDVLPQELVMAKLSGKKISKKYVYNVYYFENDCFIYSLFRADKDVYWGLYDKATENSVLIEDKKDPSCGCGLLIHVVGVVDDRFILCTPVSRIKATLDLIDPKREKCSNPEIFEDLKNLSEDSNPVLMFVEFDI